MSYSPYNALIGIIFLNEFYRINKISYQEYLDNLKLKIENSNNSKIKNYLFFIKNHIDNREIMSFTQILGITTPNYNNHHINTNFSDGKINQLIMNQNCKEQIKIDNCTYYLKLNFLKIPYYDNSSNIKNSYKSSWLIYNMKLIEQSRVINFKLNSKYQFSIKINLFSIYFGSNMTFWQKIFKLYIYQHLDNIFSYDWYLTYHQNKRDIYMLGLIFKNNMLITDTKKEIIRKLSFDYNISCSQLDKIIIRWFRDIEWLRKKDYLIVINQISKHKIKTSIWKYFMVLDEFLKSYIISFI